MSVLRVLPTELIILFLHPCLFELHMMPPEVGFPSATSDDSGSSDGQVIMPMPVNLSSERLVNNGFYLMDTGDSLYLYVGRAVHPQLIQDVFDRPGFEALNSGKVTTITIGGGGGSCFDSCRLPSHVWSHRLTGV